MKILFAVLLLACACVAQELPSAPQPQKAPEFWPLQATWAAATIADSVSSSGWNGRCAEANPLFRNSRGGMSQGKYWAVNGSILVGWTFFGRWAEKQVSKADREERTILRVLVAMPAAVGTATHTHATIQNVRNCH